MTSPVLRQLRAVEVVSTAGLRALAQTTRALDTLTLSCGLTKDALPLLEALPQRLGLKHVEIATKLEPEALLEQLEGWKARPALETWVALPNYRVANARGGRRPRAGCSRSTACRR